MVDKTDMAAMLTIIQKMSSNYFENLESTAVFRLLKELMVQNQSFFHL